MYTDQILWIFVHSIPITYLSITLIVGNVRYKLRSRNSYTKYEVPTTQKKVYDHYSGKIQLLQNLHLLEVIWLSSKCQYGSINLSPVEIFFDNINSTNDMLKHIT